MTTSDVHRHLTFHRQFLTRLRQFGDRPFVACGETSRTYAEHVDSVFRVCNALENQLDVGHDTRFGVLALNSIEYLELYHAAFFGTGVINPLNIRLAAKELAFILEDSSTEVVFVDATFAPLIEAIRDQVASLRAVVFIGTAAPDGVRIDATYNDLVAGADAVETPETDEDDPCCLMYTGGTTGLPKGVLHTQRSQVIMTQILVDNIPTTADDRSLLATPMFHAASSLGINAFPFTGGALVIVPMFTPAAVLDSIEKHRITVAGLVPVMLRMTMDDPGYSPEKFATVRLYIYGASPMPAGLLNRFQANHPDIDLLQIYGMTEGLPVTCLSPEAHRAGGDRLRSAGRVAAGVQVQIQDENGQPVEQGQPGEICVRSGFYMREYWHRDDATNDAFAGGWYHTGDAGYLDAGGYVFLVDRVKDMIVSGGENVYSAEVESALSTHPAVADVAVIGIPSDEWGEAVHAVVVVRDGESVTEADLVAHARNSIAGYKVPRSVDLRTEPLPVSGAGKTLKRALRDPYWEGIERRVN